jgi:DNA ligase-1
MKPFKPMLAASMDADEGQTIDTLTYPVLATPKIDGIRTLIIEGVATTRSLKAPIPNLYIQSVLNNHRLSGLDGELLVGKSEPGATFSQCTDGIMREDGQPDFRFFVFDRHDLGDTPYSERVRMMKLKLSNVAADDFGLAQFLVPLVPVEMWKAADLRFYAEQQLALGFEGVMVRKPDGPYKFGRATFKEGYLTKIKPLDDAEATVVGFEEAMKNNNVAETNALGRTERSSCKANLSGKGTLGALVCRNEELWPRQTFNIGTGFTDADRAKLWEIRNLPWVASGPLGLIGRTVKFRYQKIGTQDKPRIPSFLGFRDARDL